MIRVGLTGGLASGKSFVGQALEQLGCFIIRADVLGHAALTRGTSVFEKVVEAFGTAIVDHTGEIDRKLLGKRVFSEAGSLTTLNELVHPWVFQREAEMLAEQEERDLASISVVEAAILIETGSYKRFQRLILTACTEEQQIDRAMKRAGYTRAEAIARIARQMPLAKKKRFADYIIDTSGTEEQTLAQTRDVFSSLRRLANET